MGSPANCPQHSLTAESLESRRRKRRFRFRPVAIRTASLKTRPFLGLRCFTMTAPTNEPQSALPWVATHRAVSIAPIGVLVVSGLLYGQIALAQATPQPLPKSRSCPSGYMSSGAYCSPQAGARYAIPKNGNCPSGYYSSGDYCLATDGARLAIPKSGACPSGYSSSGRYCLKNKR